VAQSKFIDTYQGMPSGVPHLAATDAALAAAVGAKPQRLKPVVSPLERDGTAEAIP
jgi:hypothetical protein